MPCRDVDLWLAALAGNPPVCHPVPEWHRQDTHVSDTRARMALAGHSPIVSDIPCQDGTGRTLSCLSSFATVEWHWQDTHLFVIPCQNGIGGTLGCLSSHARMALAGHSPVGHPVPDWHWWDTHLFVIPWQNC